MSRDPGEKAVADTFLTLPDGTPVRNPNKEKGEWTWDDMRAAITNMPEEAVERMIEWATEEGNKDIAQVAKAELRMIRKRKRQQNGEES